MRQEPRRHEDRAPAPEVESRIRGRALQRIRDEWKRDHGPFCVRCAKVKRVRLWTQLDHIVALDNGGKEEDSNRQGLCDRCHYTKTREDMGFSERRKFDLAGNPIE